MPCLPLVAFFFFFFTWSASLDRILTTDDLQKRPILAIICAEQKVWGIYGPWFLVCLVFIGLCRIRLLRCSIAGRVSCPLEVLCHIVCVGVFDRNEMLDALRIVNGLFFRLSLFSSLLSLSGV